MSDETKESNRMVEAITNSSAIAVRLTLPTHRNFDMTSNDLMHHTTNRNDNKAVLLHQDMTKSTTFKPLKKRLHIHKQFPSHHDDQPQQQARSHKHSFSVPKDDKYIVMMNEAGHTLDGIDDDCIDLDALTYYPPEDTDEDDDDDDDNVESLTERQKMARQGGEGKASLSMKRHQRKRYRKHVDSDDEEGDPEFIPPKRVRTYFRKKEKLRKISICDDTYNSSVHHDNDANDEHIYNTQQQRH